MKQSTLIASLVAAVLILAVALVFALRPRATTGENQGEEWDYDSEVEVVLNSSRTTSTIDFKRGVERPNDGNIFLVCDITIKNHSAQTKSFLTPYLGIPKTSTFRYAAREFPHSDSSSSGGEITVPAKGFVIETVYFEVPVGTAPDKIELASKVGTITR